MGFLDQKERVMDTIITQEGRSQLARFGKLNPSFYSFSDAGVVYDTSTIVTGSSIGGLEVDETYRPMLESANLPQDNITFERDDSGYLNRKTLDLIEGASGEQWAVSLQRGEYFVRSTEDGEEMSLRNFIDTNNFTSFAQQYGNLNGYAQSNFTNSFLAFKDQQILKSPDPLSHLERVFKVSPEQMTFQFSDTSPIENANSQEADVNHAESLFLDKRLSHQPAFQYLPPVYETQIGDTTLTPEANYPDLSEAPILVWSDLQKDLSKLEFKGMMQQIIFAETSTDNNLFSQMFEYSNGISSKLDVIDFGLFKDNDVTRHVFFVGKLFKDGYSQPTFVNMFVLVYELADF